MLQRLILLQTSITQSLLLPWLKTLYVEVSVKLSQVLVESSLGPFTPFVQLCKAESSASRHPRRGEERELQSSIFPSLQQAVPTLPLSLQQQSSCWMKFIRSWGFWQVPGLSEKFWGQPALHHQKRMLDPPDHLQAVPVTLQGVFRNMQPTGCTERWDCGGDDKLD